MTEIVLDASALLAMLLGIWLCAVNLAEAASYEAKLGAARPEHRDHAADVRPTTTEWSTPLRAT